MRATRPSYPIYLETKISLSPRDLSKLHLSLVSELHGISLEATTGLHFHNLKKKSKLFRFRFSGL